MKKLIIIVLVMISVVTGFISFALDKEKYVSECLSESNFDNSGQDKEIIQGVLKNNYADTQRMLIENYDAFGFNSKEEVPKEYGKPYKVYQLGDIFSSFKNNKNISGCIDKSYFWEIPLLDNDGNILNTITVGKEKDNWSIVSAGKRFNNDLLKFYSDDDAVREYLKSEYNIEKVNKISRITAYYFDGIHIRQNNKEYIIPITARPELFKIKNLGMYTIEEFIPKYKNMLSSFGMTVENINH
ncbi:hypothetical protein Dtox_1674 [Desulfofarcimen acetoxidans DSM 771]|uniref:Uncharacterized protein n=1 Tax=Desulfofarcimen acetoxidans (strain ATCC 49208 / DSM 771 / KCTC 5769 / VKM B-1644 / 5575) TaxID=485916 RepID=C8VWV5_DESAS|nr:hypothetical protein [Desulfofarcimen acetoxidans]ACV62531.1 hypothetical protein Dtox_1674 [Desulfofarcimen acetoxidans DSM 771]